VPVFTVAESVALGYEPVGSLGLINTGAAAAKVTEISRRFGFDVDPHALIEDLPVGVQQRVEIIKALARDAKVLILDEPTAALDTESEVAVQQAIDALVKDKTVIVITHRLSTISGAQQIVVVADGQIAVSGTHQELLAQDGIYRRLWQAGGWGQD